MNWICDINGCIRKNNEERVYINKNKGYEDSIMVICKMCEKYNMCEICNENIAGYFCIWDDYDTITLRVCNQCKCKDCWYCHNGK